MSIELTFVLLAAIVAVGHLVQTATGFGAMLICVAVGSQLMGIEELIRLTLPIAYVQTLYIVLRHHDGLAWSLLLRRVLPLMGFGVAASFVVLLWFEGPWLALGFGVLVLALALRDLVRLSRIREAPEPPISRTTSASALLSAGLVHGMYATGGPLLVYAIGREGLTKKQFRSTISLVFVTLNTVLLTSWALLGRYDVETGLGFLVLLPALPVGVILGEWIHAWVDERRFKLIVLGLLVIAAVSLIVRSAVEVA